jgi:hypothetical protein
MQIARLVFAAAVATSAALAAPALARNTDTQKAEDQSISPSCSAYQLAPDGSWQRLPCKESSDRGQPQTQRKSGTQSADQGER